LKLENYSNHQIASAEKPSRHLSRLTSRLPGLGRNKIVTYRFGGQLSE